MIALRRVSVMIRSIGMAGHERSGSRIWSYPNGGRRRHHVREIPLADGRRLQARIWPGDEPPLVLLHGLLTSAATWNRLAGATARTCVAFDLPGFGASDQADSPSLATYAVDVDAALTLLGVERVCLVGHSFGGAVAVAVAERRRGVDGLVLLAPGGFDRSRANNVMEAPLIGRLAWRSMPLLAGMLVVKALDPGNSVDWRERCHVIAGEIGGLRALSRAAGRACNASRPAAAALAQALAGGADGARRRARFAGPVALIWSDRDILVPAAHSAAVRSAFPHADVRVLQGARHAPHHHAPAAVARMIEGLLQ